MPELFIMALGLSMDAFAVSVCKGLAAGRVRPGHMIACGLYFGIFQALMPLLGCLLGARFRGMIERYDHWIAFALLGVIGFNMIREARSGDAGGPDDRFGFAAMLPLAVATSIDALAVGVTFACLRVRVLPAVGLIGAITCALSMLGAGLGNAFGVKWKSRAELAGGLILVLLGVKILVEHLRAGAAGWI